LLLRKRGQVTITGNAQHFHALFFECGSQRAYAQTTGIFGAEIFIDNDDRKTEFHRLTPNGDKY
jgi:hypothetical protein